jgi:hypothetical protein
MKTQFFVEYEISDLISDRSFKTNSRDEAIAYYEKGYMIYEHHITVCVMLPYVSTRQIVSLTWDNPLNFEE